METECKINEINQDKFRHTYRVILQNKQLLDDCWMTEQSLKLFGEVIKNELNKLIEVELKDNNIVYDKEQQDIFVDIEKNVILITEKNGKKSEL